MEIEKCRTANNVLLAWSSSHWSKREPGVFGLTCMYGNKVVGGQATTEVTRKSSNWSKRGRKHALIKLFALYRYVGSFLIGLFHDKEVNGRAANYNHSGSNP
jgi:hypothetical protein